MVSVQELQRQIAASGLVIGSIRASRSANADICGQYVFDFFWNRALPYVGMAALVFYNCFIRHALHTIVELERHPDGTSQRISIVYKVRVRCCWGMYTVPT